MEKVKNIKQKNSSDSFRIFFFSRHVAFVRMGSVRDSTQRAPAPSVYSYGCVVEASVHAIENPRENCEDP